MTYDPQDSHWDKISSEFPNGRPVYWSRSGQPITFRQWAEARQEDRRVAEDTIGPYWVSTVWVGIDHGWTGPPLIFETMVFKKDPDDPEGLGESVAENHYSTEEQAIEGHAQVVAEVRAIEEWLEL